MINWKGVWAITSVGIKRLLAKKTVILLLLLSWAPVLILGIGFFSLGTLMTEKSISKEEQVRSKLVPRISLPVNVSALFSQLLGRVATQDILDKRLNELLPLFWRASYFHFVQMESWILLFLCLAIGPHLITPDIRSRSLPLYFSRPITLVEYTLGKSGIVIALFTQALVIPSIFMYLTSIYFMPSSEYTHLTYVLIPKIFISFLTASLFGFFLISSIGSSCKETWTFASIFIFISIGMEVFSLFMHEFIKSHPMHMEFDSSFKLLSIVSIFNDINVYLSGINNELSHLSSIFRQEWIEDPISGEKSRLGDMPLFGSGNPLWKSLGAGAAYLGLAALLYRHNIKKAIR